MGGIEQLAVDVELPLIPGYVSDSDGAAALPPGEMGQCPLRQVALAPDAEHDLKVAPAPYLSGDRLGHPGKELVGLDRASRHPESVERERRIPDPRIAVVP